MTTLAVPPVSSSLWLDETSAPGHEPLHASTEADVCVIGAGITGLSAALPLARAGKKVVVLEAGTVGGGVTGHTTGKVTVLHGLVYDELRKRHGESGAAGYAAAQQAGLERTLAWIDEYAVDCDLRMRSAYTYVRDPAQRSKIEDEVAAATDAGIAAQLVEETPLPYEIAAAIRVDDQAEYQPRAYLLGLARALVTLGAEIFERTPVTGVRERGGPIVHTATDGVEVRARDVIVATHMPFLDRAGYFARLDPKRSYLIAARIPGPAPDGMFISADEPSRSVRAHVHEGDELLLVGGEGHTAGEDGDTTPERYAALAAFAGAEFGATEVTHRWSSQDLMPADGMPFVGKLTPVSKHVLVGAGYRKWGLTSATTAGAILADHILGRDHPQADLFDPWRVTPHRQAKLVAEASLRTSKHMVGDRLRGTGDSLEELAPGEGKLLTLDGSVVAAHRSDAGEVSCVSPVCTHLGCRVLYNRAEQSWDCPCHGSRFAPDGTVLQGPAVHPLAPHEP